MTNSPSYAIEVAGLTKQYKDFVAVDHLSFGVRKAEVFALLGPNGAGKTTTVEIINTIRKPTSGRVTLLGMDVTKKKYEIIPRIGVLPQGFSSFDRITVSETLAYYSRLFGSRKTDIKGLIALVKLNHKANAQYRNLSGGLKQRLGVAVALVNDPEVVFLDEPTTGLDPRARRGVWDVLLDLKKRGKTVFLTTHYMEEAEVLADTVAIMAKGRITAMGSPTELIENNVNYVTLALTSRDKKMADIMAGIIRGMGFHPVPNTREDTPGDTCGCLQIQLEQTDDVRRILNAVNDGGASFLSLDIRRPNLETVFLQLTDESLRKESAGSRGAP